MATQKNADISKLIIEQMRKKTELRDIVTRYRKEIKALADKIEDAAMSAGQDVLPYDRR